MATETIDDTRENSVAIHPAELRLKICAATAEVCKNALGSQLQALVLTGSLARDEATLVREKGIITLLSDADFLLVLKSHSVHPSRAQLETLQGIVKNLLSESGIDLEVGLGAVSPEFFDTLRPRIFTYELKSGGRVICGDGHILERVPQYDKSALSREDAWRMLNHRIIELLAKMAAAPSLEGSLAPSLRYALTKLYLDMATSYLIFADGYQPSYAARASELRRLAARDRGPEALPFDFAMFCSRISECMQYKLTGTWLAVGEPCEFLEEAICYAIQLWTWEAAILSGMGRGIPVKSIIAAMGHRQTFAERLRGWGSLLRRVPSQTAKRNWLRWAKLSRIATPRYLVYGASFQLFCAVPEFLRDPHLSSDCVDLSQICTLLPVPPDEPTHTRNWSSLAVHTNRCYRTFLIGTVS